MNEKEQEEFKQLLDAIVKITGVEIHETKDVIALYATYQQKRLADAISSITIQLQ